MNISLMIENYRLTKRVRDFAVDAMAFQSGINLILGANGVGKSTLLMSLTNSSFRQRDARIELFQDGVAIPINEVRVSSLPQNPVIPLHLSVSDVLRYGSYIRGSDVAQVPELLERFGLGNLAQRKTGRLSGGEKQRLNLALALIGEPQLILLDEPTVALDPPGRQAFMGVLVENLKSDAIVLMSSHVASDVDFAGEVFVMDRTGFIWRGSSKEFLAHSATNRFDEAFNQVIESLA